MVVNFEFWDEEPIENVITCMHYRVDRVVFFGYEESMKTHKKGTTDFLRQICGINDVKFIALPKHEPYRIIDTMDAAIKAEKDMGNDLFFDITGGDTQVVFSFGVLAKKYSAATHFFRVRHDELVEYAGPQIKLLSKTATPQNVKFDLISFVSLRNGKLKEKKEKVYETKRILSINGINQEKKADILAVAEIMLQNIMYWNKFAIWLRNGYRQADTNRGDGEFRYDAKVKRTALSGGSGFRTEASYQDRFKNIYIYEKILKRLEAKQLVTLRRTDREIKVKFKNDTVKDLFNKEGNTLEMYAYIKTAEKKGTDDCGVSVMLDWDESIPDISEMNVHNEVDVMAIAGNVPIFISCKSGRAEKDALYELDTVAKRFGGKYSKKILAVIREPDTSIMSRARDMNIEIVCFTNNGEKVFNRQR